MNKKLTIAIGCDHTGVTFKQEITSYLQQLDHQVINCGSDEVDKAVDYPDIASAVARKVATGKADYGVVICGTGIGVSIAANKVAKIRCALVDEETTARLAREHNDANVIAFGARMIAVAKAISILQVFLTTKTSTAARHRQRVAKLQ